MEFPHQDRWAGCCSIYTMRINQEWMNSKLAQVSLLDLFLPLTSLLLPTHHLLHSLETWVESQTFV